MDGLWTAVDSVDIRFDTTLWTTCEKRDEARPTIWRDTPQRVDPMSLDSSSDIDNSGAAAHSAATTSSVIGNETSECSEAVAVC